MVVDTQGQLSKSRANAMSLSLEHRRPRGIVGDNFEHVFVIGHSDRVARVRFRSARAYGIGLLADQSVTRRVLPHREAAADEYGGKDQRHGHHCAGVAHGQLPETIAHAVGPGSHWMVMEMALDVVGQRIHRGVAILRPQCERFEHDRVDIAAQRRGGRCGLMITSLGRRRQTRAEGRPPVSSS